MEITLLDRVANRLFSAYLADGNEDLITWYWDGLTLAMELINEQIEAS